MVACLIALTPVDHSSMGSMSLQIREVNDVTS